MGAGPGAIAITRQGAERRTQNTIRISDMSGAILSGGATISIVARDVDGNQIPTGYSIGSYGGI
jgi:hypothetical protein